MLQLLTVLSSLSLLVCSCTPNNPPILTEIEPKTAVIGARLELTIHGADPDGDKLTFTASCPTLFDFEKRSSLLPMGNQAVFAWTPLAADAGQHQLQFSASDGDLWDLIFVPVTVKHGSGKIPPVFRKPLGEGTTLDMKLQKCLNNLEVEVEDPDSPGVELHQQPAIAGSQLKITGTHSAIFSWCPTQAQINQKSHVLRLEANDHENPLVYKTFSILIEPP
jgi:hypothetical protein